jgi:hypothetical protein
MSLSVTVLSVTWYLEVVKRLQLFLFLDLSSSSESALLKKETIDPLDLDGPFRCELETCLEILPVSYFDLFVGMHKQIGTSDFDAQMSGIKILRGHEILRPVYKKQFSEILSGCLHFWTF